MSATNTDYTKEDGFMGAPEDLLRAALAVVDWASASKRILVWEFHDAPRELQVLSINGGDEDWVVWVPSSLADKSAWWPWLDYIDSGRDPDKFRLPDGSVVFIGAHA